MEVGFNISLWISVWKRSSRITSTLSYSLTVIGFLRIERISGLLGFAPACLLMALAHNTLAMIPSPSSSRGAGQNQLCQMLLRNLDRLSPRSHLEGAGPEPCHTGREVMSKYSSQVYNHAVQDPSSLLFPSTRPFDSS